VELFTLESRSYLSRLPVSRAYFAFIFLSEFGKAYRIHQRGELAILYFTGTPLASPYFFRRDASGWRVDIVAALRDTAEYSGASFTWNYRGVADDYTKAFGGLLTRIDGFARFADGDNRKLRISTSLH
jgi:hypothetical protein